MQGVEVPFKSYKTSVHRAFEALQRTTGLHAQVLPQNLPDYDSHFEVHTDDGRVFDLIYEVKPTIDRRDQLLSFKTLHGSAVLITQALSSKMAEQCRELNIQFLDHAGNCFLRQPGLFAFVSGLKDDAAPKQAVARGLTPAALQVVLAVLTRPSILNGNVRQIAEVAAISHGAAGAALIALEQIGLLTNTKSGRRMLAMPDRWIDTWTEGYLGRIRPKLEKHRMSAPLPIPALLERVNPRMREVVLGGEAAAAHRNMGLKPGALTLYIDFEDARVMRYLVQELKLRRDPDGQIELVSMFWNTKELQSFPTVPDALIYADMIGTGDERVMEVAGLLKKEISKYVATEA
jgi:hypothetical protein